MRFFSDFLYKKSVMGTYLNCIDFDAIQMETDNICIYKEVDKKSTGFNLKTTEFLDCALIGACAVVRWNTVFICKNVVVQFIVFLTLSTLICRDTDISKCFSESLGIRDYESLLCYFFQGIKDLAFM